MRGGRRLDDAATSRAMLGQRATRARDTARFTALEDMIRELAPFPPSYDVSAGQDTGFAEWRYTDLLGGIYLSTQSTEINCRIMALAAVNRQRRPYALCRRLRAQPEDKYHLQDLPRPPARVVLLPGSNQLSWMVSREALSRLMFEHEEVMIKPHPLTTEADLRALGLHYGLDRILPRDASGVACVLAAGQLWHNHAAVFGRPFPFQGWPRSMTRPGNIQPCSMEDNDAAIFRQVDLQSNHLRYAPTAGLTAGGA